MTKIDREPAVCMDTLRPADDGGDRLEAVGNPVGLYGVPRRDDLIDAATNFRIGAIAVAVTLSLDPLVNGAGRISWDGSLTTGGESER